MSGEQTMISVSESVLDTVLHLSENQMPAFTAFLNTLTRTDAPVKDVSKRIGVAKDITFPSNFDDIDYGTSELFGLGE